MIKKVSLSKEEIEILDSHYRASQTLLIRARAQALLMNNEGYNAPEIAKLVRFNQKSIRIWVASFTKTRIASLFPEYTGNTNASKLTEEQKKEIQETLEKPPEDKGLPVGFWNVARIKEYISATYGVFYESERSYHHILAINNLSFKLPDGFDKRRDDILVAKRMLEIQRDILKFTKKGYIIFTADECSLCFETEFRRAWIKKGKKTILKVNRDKKRQHYFGALNMKTGVEELISLDWQDTSNMINALRELTKRYSKQKLCIIWDNAKWHRSKRLRELLGKGKEFSHIHFLWLPPYAPDHNPQEHVWKVAKGATANQCVNTFDELKNIFENTIGGKKFDYKV